MTTARGRNRYDTRRVFGDFEYADPSGLYLPTRGTPATGKAIVIAGDGVPEWTDIATQAELDAAIAGVVAGGGGTGRFWDVTAIPTDAAVQTARTLDFADGATTLTGFTWANQGTATAAIQRKRLFLTAPTNGAVTGSLRCYFPPATYQVPGATPWCVQAPFTLYGSHQYHSAGLVIKNTANGKLLRLCVHLRQDAQGYVIAWDVVRFTNETTQGGTVDFSSGGSLRGVMAIGYDGTTFNFRLSPDGQDWKSVAHTTEAAATHIGAGGTYQFGFFVDSVNTTKSSAGAFNNSVILNQATPVPHGLFV